LNHVLVQFVQNVVDRKKKYFLAGKNRDIFGVQETKRKTIFLKKVDEFLIESEIFMTYLFNCKKMSFLLVILFEKVRRVRYIFFSTGRLTGNITVGFRAKSILSIF